MSEWNRQRAIVRAGLLTIAVNIILTIARGVAGVLSGSTAVIADAANSGTDILATLVVMGGSRIASRPADESHPYGHEKAEPVAAKMVGLLVTVTGAVAFIGAFQALRSGRLESVGALAAWVTGISIGVKELMARYLIRVAKATNNQALLADAANQRTDVLASTAALVGALGGRLGLPILDPAMGLLVAGLILRMGLGLYWRSVTHLMDPAPEPETMSQLEQAAAHVAGVISVDEVKARMFGAGVYVDCKIGVDAQMTVEEGHRIGHRVKASMMRAVPAVRDVLVHINPAEVPEPLAWMPERHPDGPWPAEEEHAGR